MKILLVDVYSLTREILTHIISDIDESEIIGEAGSPEEAVKAIDELKPDTVILDMDIAEGKGSDRIIKIKNTSTQVKIFVFSMDPNPMHKKLCMELDVDAYLEISHDFEKIRELLIDGNWKEQKSITSA